MTLQIQIPKTRERFVLPILKALGVKIISSENALLQEIEESLKEVKAMKAGTIPKKTLKEALRD